MADRGQYDDRAISSLPYVLAAAGALCGVLIDLDIGCSAPDDVVVLEDAARGLLAGVLDDKSSSDSLAGGALN